ncbi:FAD-binding oxidoreductase [Streptomyces verrucosisporus]|uniref:FAD-binding oxidoreductase n=1 Tax=Streptomyces verrucosisporus TaxID=1695161 RepID=UPI0019D0105A|nr:FAD-binding oxidoreductase [Streptomyces verrucosisporus]MBN3929578.1 FAD-binding oxidoreductase [Streptomyces verrucosisporus]
MVKRRTLLGAAGLAAAGGVLAPAGGAAARPRRTRWDRLEARLRGDLVLPGDDGYDRARQLASSRFDGIRPQAVVYAETPRDVAVSLLFAQHHGIHTAVRSGGHSYGGWSTTEGLVVNLTRMRHVAPAPGCVRLGPGSQSVDIVTALSPYGMSVPGGFCPTVSPGGFITGGGTGWHYRKYGPASDQLLSARVVLADGRVVEASEREHSDLFWALRGGGGGNFGVVTDFRMRPTPVTRVVHYALTWTWDDAGQAVPGYLDWVDSASEDLACGALVRLPDAGPGTLPVVIVSGVHFGTAEQLDEELGELVSLVGKAPATRMTQEMPYERAMMRVFGCEDRTADACHLTGSNPEATLPRQAYVLNRGRMFDRALPRTGVDSMLAAFDADRRAGQSRVVSLLGLGKNANLPSVGSTAWPHRDTLYSATLTVSLASPTPAPEDSQAAQSWLDGLFDVIDPYSNGHSYVNFPDTRLEDYADAYYGPNLDRLIRVKRAYDPYGFFTFPQAVPA